MILDRALGVLGGISSRENLGLVLALRRLFADLCQVLGDGRWMEEARTFRKGVLHEGNRTGMCANT